MDQLSTFLGVYMDYRTRLDILERRYSECKTEFYGNSPCDLNEITKKLNESEREMPLVTTSCEIWRQNTLAVAHKVFEQKRRPDMQLPVFRDTTAFSPVIENEEIHMCENCRVRRCDVKYTGKCSAGTVCEADACICLEKMCTVPWCSDCISPELYKAISSTHGINCRIQCTKCLRGICAFSYIRCRFVDDVLGSIALTNAGARFMQAMDIQCRRAMPLSVSSKSKDAGGAICTNGTSVFNGEHKLRDIHCFNCGGEWKSHADGHYTKKCSVERNGIPRYICFHCKKTWPTGRLDYNKGVVHCTAHCPLLRTAEIRKWTNQRTLARLRLTVQGLSFPELDKYAYDTIDKSTLPIPNFNFELVPESAIVQKRGGHGHGQSRVPRIKANAKADSPYSTLKPDDLQFSLLAVSSQESDINMDLLINPEDFANEE